MRMLNLKSYPTNNFASSTASTSLMSSSGYSQAKSYQLEPFKFCTPHTPLHPTEMFRSKKEETPLKKIVNCNRTNGTPSSKLKTQVSLRNTSFVPFGQEKYSPILKKDGNDEQIENRQGKYARYKEVSTPTQGKALSYQKILQKINKKQRLIQQLKELSKTSITDMIKTPKKETKEKAAYNNILNKSIRNNGQNKRGYFSQPNKDKNQASDTCKNVRIDFNRSAVEFKKYNEPSLSAFKEKLQIKIPEHLKNPQEERGNMDFKKAKNSYYTHREVKSQGKMDEVPLSPLLGLSKKYSLMDKKQQQSETLYHSSRYIYETSIDLSPLTPKGQQSKSIHDMRQRRAKNNVTYFTNKTTTIYHFQTLKTLGEGRFGTVLQAIHKQTNSIFAIKKIAKRVIKENQMIEQLIKEIKIQSYCRHENILDMYGMFDDKQFVYLVLEYMEEGTLFQQLKKRKILSEKETVSKIRHVAQAVVYLHEKGIAHRDIKPQNIVLSNGIGKLCDFGWATLCDATRRKTYCGTFDYAAPQILEGVEYDMSVDLWCLGILTYELLVGKAPFYHFSRKQTMKKIINVENEAISYPSHVSKAAISFVESLIKKNPQDRLSGANILNHPFLAMEKQSK